MARGEQVLIEGPAGGPAYAAIPQGATRGVVVIHEIFGPQPEIERVVHRFADQGYAAVAPDLFHSGNKLTCIRAAMRAIATGQGPQIEQIGGARAWLGERAGVAAPAVGLIGFCIGGGFALAAGRGWGAVSTNYGDIPPPRVLAGVGPTIGCYGGRDLLFRRHGDRLRAALVPQGTKHEIHVFADAGHSFLTDGHHPIAGALTAPLLHVAYDPSLAEQGWGKILAFFDAQLPPA
jgi:carboxymethylenebutenolidase